MADNIKVEIELDLDSFKKALKDAEDQGQSSGKKLGDNFSKGAEDSAQKGLGSLTGLVKAVFSLQLVQIALDAGRAIGRALTAPIEEAMQQDRAISSLNTALSLTGQYSEATSASMLALAESLQKTTGISDNLIVSGQSLLLTVGRLNKDALEPATKAALDLAAATGISTEAAFEKLARAAQGGTEGLRRYGIVVKETGDKTVDFNNALAQIQSKFSGASSANVNTFAGSLTLLDGAFNKVLEALGAIFTRSPALQKLIKFLADSFFNLAEMISNAFSQTDVIGEFLKTLITVGQFVVEYLIKPFEFAFNIIKTGFLAIATIATSVVSIFTDSVDQINEKLQGMTVASANGVFDFDVATASQNYLTKLDETIGVIGQPTQDAVLGITTNTKNVVEQNTVSMLDGIKAKLTEFANFSKGFVNQVGQAFQTLTSGLARGFAQVGTNLVQGQSAFKNFGKIMLGILGDIAIQFGSFFILTGAGKILLGDPSGAGLIAAGIGLSILGGVLKGLSGGQEGVGGGAATAGAGGESSFGGGGGVQPQGQAGQEELKPSTQVAVNVQGNILDRRQTGLEIVEVINEAFGTNGVQFATTANA